MILARLTPLSEATPELLVVAEPAAAPFSVKLTDLLLTAVPFAVRVAARMAVPPAAPEPLIVPTRVGSLLIVRGPEPLLAE